MKQDQTTILDYELKRFLVKLAKEYKIDFKEVVDKAVELKLPALDKVTQAELCQELDSQHIIQAEAQWQFERHLLRLRCELKRLPPEEWPQHAHWDWIKKLPSSKLLAYNFFGVLLGEKWQGIMAANRLPTHQSRDKATEGKELIYIEFIEVAPWNVQVTLAKLGDHARYGAVGSRLVEAAIKWSISEGLNGRLGLHALPQSSIFYTRCGMTSHGRDSRHGGMEYFEMSEAQAAAFIQQRP